MSSPAVDRYVAAYRAAPSHDARRDAAIARFAELGFPTLKTEAWKYTNVASLTRTQFAPARPANVAPESIKPFLIEGLRHIVLVNGRAVDPAVAGRFVDLPDEHDAFPALNAALMRDPVVIQAREPIQIIHVAAPSGTELCSPRIIVSVDGEATLVESYTGAGVYWTNAVTEISLAPGTRLTHVKLQDEGPQSFHTGLCRVRIGRDAAYRSLVVSSGARLARNEIAAAVVGEGAECRLDGIALVGAGQHADNTTLIEHRVPRGQSVERYKAVVDDDGRSVFQGSILVERDAQKTDARQMHSGLLLSPRAHIDAKPELRILADDVKCAHGTTVGDLDPDWMFYLRSRGIDPDTARALLIEAFVSELFEPIATPAIRAALDERLHRWLA